MVKKKHRYILTELWQSRWFKSLSNGAKYLYLYLLTNPKSNICGVYEIMDEQVKFDTDIINLDKTFVELQQANEVVRIEDWCIILRYPLNQNWQTAWAIGDRINEPPRRKQRGISHGLKSSSIWLEYSCVYSSCLP